MSKPTRIRRRFYRRTEAANSILAESFLDATGNYLMNGYTVTGVWVSDRPLDGNEDAVGDTLLQIEVLPASDVYGPDPASRFPAPEHYVRDPSITADGAGGTEAGRCFRV